MKLSNKKLANPFTTKVMKVLSISATEKMCFKRAECALKR